MCVRILPWCFRSAEVLTKDSTGLEMVWGRREGLQGEGREWQKAVHDKTYVRVEFRDFTR